MNLGFFRYCWSTKEAKSWMLFPLNPIAVLYLARQPRNLFASHCPGSGKPASAASPESSRLATRSHFPTYQSFTQSRAFKPSRYEIIYCR